MRKHITPETPLFAALLGAVGAKIEFFSDCSSDEDKVELDFERGTLLECVMSPDDPQRIIGVKVSFEQTWIADRTSCEPGQPPVQQATIFFCDDDIPGRTVTTQHPVDYEYELATLPGDKVAPTQVFCCPNYCAVALINPSAKIDPSKPHLLSCARKNIRDEERLIESLLREQTED